MPPAVEAALPHCDVVFHAGDVVTHHLLDHLASFAPVIAVLGNNDIELRSGLPERVEVVLAGVHVALVHETGAAKGRAGRVRRWFPDADVVVFGHSHAPMNEWHDGQLLFNPGSAVERRREPTCTYGLLDLVAGRVTRHEIVAVD